MTFADLIAQLTYTPDVNGKVPSTRTLVIGGMGGSALAGDALSFLSNDYDVLMHRGYGLPNIQREGALYIALSYSGNTEETLDFARAALSKNYPIAVVASGGQLLQFARTYNVPYATVPTGIVPRNAYLYLVRGLLALLGEEKILKAFASLKLNEEAIREAAEQDAHFIVHGVPVFYASERNRLLPDLAACIMNESARTPAFRNTFSEMNHNEMQAFDADMPGGLMHLFRMIIVRDEGDDARILRRMHVFERLMRERQHIVRTIDLAREKRVEELATFWMRMLMAARMLAETRGIDPDTQPLVDEFKTLL